MGEPGFYYCRYSPHAQARRAKEAARAARRWQPPIDPILAAKRDAAREIAIEVFDPAPAEPRDPFERWTDVEVES